jgi:hypothetical protein
MNTWPFFHHDGTVTVQGEVVGRKFVSGLGGFRFACKCGHVATQPLVRLLRRAVTVHLASQEHVDRMQEVSA